MLSIDDKFHSLKVKKLLITMVLCLVDKKRAFFVVGLQQKIINLIRFFASLKKPLIFDLF